MLRELHGSVGRSEQEGECRLHPERSRRAGGAGARTIRSRPKTAEALAASLNRFGRVEFSYMESLASRSRQELTDELGARIFYNPMVKGYEIRERLAAGNVVAKAE